MRVSEAFCSLLAPDLLSIALTCWTVCEELKQREALRCTPQSRRILLRWIRQQPARRGGC